MVAVGDNGTIVSSDDAGQRWRTQTSNTNARLVDVDIINPVIAVGDGGEVLTSMNQASGSAAASGVSGGAGATAEFTPYEREEEEVPFGGEWLIVLGLLGRTLRGVRTAVSRMRGRAARLRHLASSGSPRLRFGLLFVAILGLMMVTFPQVETEITQWYLQPMSVATAALLNVAGIDARLSMDSISQGFCLLTMPRTTFRIILECTGIFTAFILVAAMLATPSTWSRRITGVLAVIPAAFAYGVVRLVVLGSIGYHLPYAIQFFHLWLMALANTAFAMILWHYWSREAWSHA